jgi:hypothetical protein
MKVTFLVTFPLPRHATAKMAKTYKADHQRSLSLVRQSSGVDREISVCAGLRGGAGRTRTSNQTVIADTSEPGLVSLIYRRSGRGSCTRCSVFLRADRSFRPFRAFS